MSAGLSFNIAHTAVLAMDCQAGIVSMYAKPPDAFVARASSVLQAARTAAPTWTRRFTTRCFTGSFRHAATW